MAFTPEHMTASEKDFEGNNGIGRYVLLPGSDGRAEKIAQNFSDVTVTRHSRRHNVYKGTLEHLGKSIDVAAVSSGMGTPSLDIIVNELGQLGVKRFLRVGTAGLLQPDYMNAGDFVIGTGAVRDDGATPVLCPPRISGHCFDGICSGRYAGSKSTEYERPYTYRTHPLQSLTICPRI